MTVISVRDDSHGAEALFVRVHALHELVTRARGVTVTLHLYALYVTLHVTCGHMTRAICSECIAVANLFSFAAADFRNNHNK